MIGWVKEVGPSDHDVYVRTIDMGSGTKEDM